MMDFFMQRFFGEQRAPVTTPPEPPDDKVKKLVADVQRQAARNVRRTSLGYPHIKVNPRASFLRWECRGMSIVGYGDNAYDALIHWMGMRALAMRQAGIR